MAHRVCRHVLTLAYRTHALLLCFARNCVDLLSKLTLAAVLLPLGALARPSSLGISASIARLVGRRPSLVARIFRHVLGHLARPLAHQRRSGIPSAGTAPTHLTPTWACTAAGPPVARHLFSSTSVRPYSRPLAP